MVENAHHKATLARPWLVDDTPPADLLGALEALPGVAYTNLHAHSEGSNGVHWQLLVLVDTETAREAACAVAIQNQSAGMSMYISTLGGIFDEPQRIENAWCAGWQGASAEAARKTRWLRAALVLLAVVGVLGWAL